MLVSLPFERLPQVVLELEYLLVEADDLLLQVESADARVAGRGGIRCLAHGARVVEEDRLEVLELGGRCPGGEVRALVHKGEVALEVEGGPTSLGVVRLRRKEGRASRLVVRLLMLGKAVVGLVQGVYQHAR